MPNLALPVSTSRRPMRLAWRLRTAVRKSSMMLSRVNCVRGWVSGRNTSRILAEGHSVLQLLQGRVVVEGAEEEPAAGGGLFPGAGDEGGRVVPEREAVDRDGGAGGDVADGGQVALLLVDERLGADAVVGEHDVQVDEAV